MKQAVKTITVGRASKADILLEDQTVSRLHAELTMARDGRLYLTDRVSANGTYRRVDGKWQELVHDFVTLEDEVRFGEYALTVHALMGMMPGEGEGGEGKKDERLRGPVERDPETGEIIGRSS